MNCTALDIRINGKGNVVYINGLSDYLNTSCSSDDYNSISIIIALIIMFTILISCICCCFLRRKNRQLKTIIATNQPIDQDNVDNC